MFDPYEALLELANRRRPFCIESFCFPEQVAFIRDESKFKTGVCSRRAGKTVSCAADLTDTALSHDGTVSLYITLSRLNAKRIIWPDLLEINRTYALGGVVNETELCITFPNRSRIFLSGAKDKTEIEKFRGLALKKVYIDEAQSFKAYIQELIDEVLTKALFDHDGSLILIGTPGPVPAGYFYEASQSPSWSHHAWTMLQNPHLEAKSGKSALQLIDADCARMGVTRDDPRVQRECFGRWATDPNSLVVRWQARNDFGELPHGVKWQYVLGVDLGFSDADALACIGWHDKAPHAYLVDESIKRKQGITELVAAISAAIKRYDPVAIVMDTGGLGLKIAEELRRRYAIPIKAAEKTRKFEFLELLNDAMATGRFYAQRQSQFVQDSFMVEWDRDKSTGDRLVISDTFHSDIIDAVLYAYRESLHWLHVPEAPKAKIGTKEWLLAQEAEHIETIIKQQRRDSDDPATWEVGWDEWQAS